MSKPFAYKGHTYTFERQAEFYTIRRDDGLVAWDVFATAFGVTAYKPAFPSVAECKDALMGKKTPTYYNRLVFAASSSEAKIAWERDHA